MHPKFKTTETYDRAQGRNEKAQTSWEGCNKQTMPEELDSDQDCDLLENRNTSEKRGIARVKRVIETLPLTHMPKRNYSEMETIMSEYSDVFY